MRIFVVRHGETEWNKLGKIQGVTDIPLNDTGIMQATAAAQYLSDFHVDVVITSPLLRAKQTASIIAEEMELPIMEMEQFKERCFGAAEGMTLNERQMKFPKHDYPNQESIESVRKRTMQGLHQIQREHDGKNIILAAHGAVINSMLAELSDNQIGTGKTLLANACISTIVFAQNKWKVENYNEVEHLHQLMMNK